MKHIQLHSKKKIEAAIEMYLKTIHLTNQEQAEVKASDLVKILEIKKSSVSEMLLKLKEKEYIEYTAFKPIQLTKKGKQKANKILDKYNTLYTFLKNTLNIKNPQEEACKLEHVVSNETISKLKELIKNN